MLRTTLRKSDAAQDIKRRYIAGEITLAEANELGEPLLAEINEKARAIARKYKKQHQDILLSRVW